MVVNVSEGMMIYDGMWVCCIVVEFVVIKRST